MSFERLICLASAKRRNQAEAILDLAQTIVAGMMSTELYSEKQNQLIEQLKSGIDV